MAIYKSMGGYDIIIRDLYSHNKNKYIQLLNRKIDTANYITLIINE